MTSKLPPRFELVPDPYAGDLYVFPESLCSHERRMWFRRTNQILAFFHVTECAAQQSRVGLRRKIAGGVLKPETPIRIKPARGGGVITSAQRLSDILVDSIDILARQVFVMLYGSLETYLLQIFERSYAETDPASSPLERSLHILMRRRWDGKFCAMRDTFGVDYKSSWLIAHFRGFEMRFGPTTYQNPLDFLDEVTRIRHSIVHASSISERGDLLFINAKLFLPAYGFYALLTDYIDALFSARFGFERLRINPAEA